MSSAKSYIRGPELHYDRQDFESNSGGQFPKSCSRKQVALGCSIYFIYRPKNKTSKCYVYLARICLCASVVVDQCLWVQKCHKSKWSLLKFMGVGEGSVSEQTSTSKDKKYKDRSAGTWHMWIMDVCFHLCHRVVESKSWSAARFWCRPHWALGQSRPFFDPCQAKPSVNVALWLPSTSGSRIVQSAMTTATLKMGSSSLFGNVINLDRFVLSSYLYWW